VNHPDHVALIQKAISGPGGVWADFGSGTGAFTLALAELIGPQGDIYSVDKDAGALLKQERAMRERFPDRFPAKTYFITADFTQPLDLPPLDGALMANALHFQRQKTGVIGQVHHYLRPGGRFVLVEYNADRGNFWVPYPISLENWRALASRCGFVDTQLLARRPSRFLREIYSALSIKPAD
jgi:ubiquinone/menaquinone biosynthesis C-methylase UbiE